MDNAKILFFSIIFFLFIHFLITRKKEQLKRVPRSTPEETKTRRLVLKGVWYDDKGHTIIMKAPYSGRVQIRVLREKDTFYSGEVMGSKTFVVHKYIAKGFDFVYIRMNGKIKGEIVPNSKDIKIVFRNYGGKYLDTWTKKRH